MSELKVFHFYLKALPNIMLKERSDDGRRSEVEARPGNLPFN